MTYGINELFAYQMQSPYWDIELYEDEDLNMYNVVVNNKGIPIFINTMETFLDRYQSKKGIFVLTLDNILRMGYKLHHSDLTAGHPVLCAGEFALNKNGSIKIISNRSGHFLPNKDCLEDVLSIIYMNGYHKNIQTKYINP